MPINLTTKTDEQLTDLLLDIHAEQRRRADLAEIPATVTEMSRRYQAGGGSVADLEAAIHAEPEPETEPEADPLT